MGLYKPWKKRLSLKKNNHFEFSPLWQDVYLDELFVCLWLCLLPFFVRWVCHYFICNYMFFNAIFKAYTFSVSFCSKPFISMHAWILICTHVETTTFLFPPHFIKVLVQCFVTQNNATYSIGKLVNRRLIITFAPDVEILWRQLFKHLICFCSCSASIWTCS